MARVALLLSFLTFTISCARAQVEPVYGQCGGEGFTGSVVCAAGSTCVYSNPWYSQCLPGVASTSAKPSSTTSKVSTSSTKPSTTTSPVPSTSPSTAPSGSTKYWFSFGDSYTQTGFNNTLTPLPSPSNVFGNPPYPGYTACGSYVNWIDVVASQYGTATSLEVWNHAYGGATINATLVAPYEPTVLSLDDQVSAFLQTEASKPSFVPWTASTALFSFFIGINDIGNSYYLGGNTSAFNEVLLSAYFKEVQAIYNAGGRQFLFINVPPVDRSPLMLSQAASAQALEKSVINDFNSRLASHATAFASANPGATTYYYDANTEVNSILDNYTKYGFTDNTSYGDVVHDCWCNNYHISPPIHQQLAAGIAPILKSAKFFN